MAKLTLTDISSGYLTQAAYNANNDLIEAAMELTLSRDGTTPNTMSAALDLNSQDVNNVNDINMTGNILGAITGNFTAVQIAGVSVVPGSTLSVATAANVPNVAAGGIVATDVQAAIDELDVEVVRITGTQTVAGAKTFSDAVDFTVAVTHDTNLILTEQAAATDPTAGLAKIWVKDDAPNRPFFTDDTDVDRKIVTSDVVVSGHVRAGNTQLQAAGTVGSSVFDVVADLVANTFETVGPTGSGADNISPSECWSILTDLHSTRVYQPRF